MNSIHTPLTFNGGALLSSNLEQKGKKLNAIHILITSIRDRDSKYIPHLEFIESIKFRSSFHRGVEISYDNGVSWESGRTIDIIDWVGESFQTGILPCSALVFLIGEYGNQEEKEYKKICEITQGFITPTTFKILQENMTNLILNGRTYYDRFSK